MKDIDRIIADLTARNPGSIIEQLVVRHPADDNGLWYITLPDLEGELQIESSTGQCPFLIESDFSDVRITATSVQETVSAVEAIITSARNMQSPHSRKSAKSTGNKNLGKTANQAL